MNDEPVPLALGSQRSPETAATRPLVLVPVGSTEQHGPHLPLATDAVVANAASRAAALALRAGGRSVVVAPPVSYGASGEHEGFAGTISIGHEALHAVLVEIGRSACSWADALVFVNGHGGNVPTVSRAVQLLRHEGRAAAWVPCAVPGDAHAGRTETSLMLHLAPSSVRTDLAVPGATDPLPDLLPLMREGGVQAVALNGVLGDPTGASADEGERLLLGLVERLVAALAELDADPTGRLRVPTAATSRPGAPGAPGATGPSTASSTPQSTPHPTPRTALAEAR